MASHAAGKAAQAAEPPVVDPEDIEKAEMLRSVIALRAQLAISRMNVSDSLTEMRRFCEAAQPADPLVNPVEKRQNPWAEKSKCAVL